MRNSFEEMKKYIAEQDELLLDASEKQHERTRYQDGYETEGQAGTSSTGGRSEYTLNSSRPFANLRIFPALVGAPETVSVQSWKETNRWNRKKHTNRSH
jgi:hypothetical protein